MKTMTNFIIDELGMKLADLAELQKEIKALKGQLIDALDEGEAGEGDLFRAVHVHQETATVNWKAITEKLGASAQMIAGNTKKGHKNFIKVTARKAEQKAA